MPAPFPTHDSHPDLLPQCACLVLLSNSDQACAVMFPMAHPAWPAPNAPAIYGPADLADAAQGALCGAALHMGTQLGRLDGVNASPSWIHDDWMDESRCLSQSLDGVFLAFPQAFIHLEHGGEHDVWVNVRGRFIAIAQGLFGPASLILDAEKAYRSEPFWASIRQGAIAIDESSRISFAADSPHSSADLGSGRI